MANSIIGNVIVATLNVTDLAFVIILLLGMAITWGVKLFRSNLFGGFTS